MSVTSPDWRYLHRPCLRGRRIGLRARGAHGPARVGRTCDLSSPRPARRPMQASGSTMTTELRRRRDRLKQRLSKHLSASQDAGLNIPPALAVKDVIKKGWLLKLSSRGRLYPRCWKKRLCVLTKDRLFIYKTERDSGREKPAGDIDLSVFSHCKEAGSKDAKKIANTFVIYRSDTEDQNLARHVFAAPCSAEMSDWLRQVRGAARPSGRHPRRGGAPAPAEGTAVRKSALRPSSCADPVTVPLPPEDGATRRSRPRPQQALPPSLLLAESSSQPCLLDWPSGAGGGSSSSSSRMCGVGLSSAYEYSSSEGSASSASSSRCSVVRRLNTTMPEITLRQRSVSPTASGAPTAASNICQKMAAVYDGPPFQSKTAPRERQKRASVASLVAPLRDLESEFGALTAGGASSTCSSSLTNLTATLTREGQTMPALAADLAQLKDGLRQLSSRVDSVVTALDGSDAEMAAARADITAVQGSVTSLQTLAATLNSKMAAFSSMFRKLDEQLLEMWAEMDTVNNNVHHVMHTALESQQNNERLFTQLTELREQLLASFPDQLGGGSLPRTARRRQLESRPRRLRLDSERLCEIDDPALEEVAAPAAAMAEKVAPPAEATEKMASRAAVPLTVEVHVEGGQVAPSNDQTRQ